MGIAIFPNRWTQSPSGPLTINWGHPLAQYLVAACVPQPQGTIELVTGAWMQKPASSSLPTYVSATGITGAKFGASVGLTLPASPSVKRADGLTVFARILFTGTPPGNSELFGVYYDAVASAPYECCALQTNASGRLAGGGNNNGSLLVQPSVGGAAPTVGLAETYSYHASSAGSTLMRAGVRLIEDGTNITPILYATSTIAMGDSRATGIDSTMICDVGYIWAGPQMKGVDLSWLHEEPYALLQTRVTRRYFIPPLANSGTGAVTIGPPSVDGTGGILNPVTGTGAVTIGPPSIDGSGDTGLQPDARVTQVAAEVFGSGPVSARVTQVALEVFGRLGEVAFVNDRIPGLTHIEITMSDGTVEPWSVIPMDDPLTYDYGRKVSRILQWNDIRRASGDFYGQPVAADFRFTMRDKDLHALGYLGNPAHVFINRYTVTRSISDPDRRKQLTRRIVFRGPIRSVAPRAGATHDFTVKDYLQERFGPNSDVASLPRRKVLKDDFPQCAVELVNSSAEGYIANGTQLTGAVDGMGAVVMTFNVHGGVGTFAADQIVFANHATVYTLSASSLTDPETQVTLGQALTADVPDGTVITQIPTHRVTPALGLAVPVRAGRITDYQILDGDDNGDGQGKPLYVGDEVVNGHTYAIFAWACHGCFGAGAGQPIQMLYFWNGSLFTAGFVTYQQGNDLVAHAIGDLATEAGSGGRVLVPGYANWTDAGFSGSIVDRNGRRYVIYGLRGILRDMAIGVRSAPLNLGGVPHTVNGRGMDSSLNGQGSEVRDIHDQFVLVFNNFLWGDYQSGAPLPHPTFPDDPTLTLINLESVARAKAHAQTLVPGGFVGDWSWGVDNEQVTMATIFQWFIRCMGVEQSWDRKTRIYLDREIFDPTIAMLGAPTLTDERDIQKLSFVIDEAPTLLFTALPFVHTKDECGRTTTGWRSSTADVNVGPIVGEYADDPATIAKYSPSGTKLYSQPLEFRLLRGKNRDADADDTQQGSDTIAAILRYKLATAKVRIFSLTTWGKGYSIEIFDRLWIQHLANVGGRTPRPARVIEHDAQPDRWRVTLKCFDLQGIFGGAATAITGTGAVTIGPPAVDATGAVTGTAPSGVTLGAPTVDSSGDAGALLGATIGAPVVAGSGTVETPGTGDVTIGAPSVIGGNAPLDSGVTIGAPAVSGTGTEQIPGTGAAVIGAPTVVGAGSSSGTGLLIATTDVAQSIIDAHPAGTTFTVQAGLHRDAFTPRTGDTYNGETGAIFSGAIALTSHTGSNPWVYANQHQAGTYNTAAGAAYQAGHDASGHPENVYFDNAFLEMVSNFSDGGPGKAFFDYGAATISIWDDPSGHTVECSVLPTAVAAASVGANYNNIIFEKYACLTQQAAVVLGAGNVMSSCEVRLNHYGGIETGPGAQVFGGRVHHNGVFGFIGSGNPLIQGVEVDHNNLVFGDPFWGAGGSKWVFADGLRVLNCNSHDNLGPGFWTDINNINVLYDGNTCTNNLRAGIFHEISYAAVISNNTCTNNGNTLFGSYPTEANISVCDSPNVEVKFNTCTGGAWGIGVLQDDRGGSNPDQNHGLWETANLNVHHNTITISSGVAAGMYGNGDTSYFTSRGNSFHDNTFNTGSIAQPFQWNGALDLAGFHAAGQS